MGIAFSAEDVLAAGERIYTLERRYNNLAGFGEGSRHPCQTFTTEPWTLVFKRYSPERPDARGVCAGRRAGRTGWCRSRNSRSWESSPRGRRPERCRRPGRRGAWSPGHSGSWGQPASTNTWTLRESFPWGRTACPPRGGTALDHAIQQILDAGSVGQVDLECLSDDGANRGVEGDLRASCNCARSPTR